MAKRKCQNCGALLKGGTYHCDYCGSDWTPVPKIEPGSPIPSIPEAIPVYDLPNSPASPPQKSGTGRIVVFFILLMFCWPVAIIYMWTTLGWKTGAKIAVTIILCLPIIIIGTYGGLYETVFAVRSDLPKFSSEPLPVDQRKTEDISSVQIFEDMKKSEMGTLDHRRKTWKEKYEDRWILWEGQIESIHVYSDSDESRLVILPDDNAGYSIEVFFDPANNSALEKLSTGDRVRVSGRIWGYYFIDNIIRLAQGTVLAQWKEKEPQQNTETKDSGSSD